MPLTSSTDNKLFADFYYFRLNEIIHNAETQEKEILLFSVLKELVRELTTAEDYFFSTDFARLIFITDKFNISSQLSAKLKRLYYYLKNFNKTNEIDANPESFYQATAILLNFILGITGIEPNKSLQNITKKYNTSDFLETKLAGTSKRIKLLQAVINKIDKENSTIEIIPENSDDIYSFYPGSEWSQIISQCRKNSTLNLINVLKKDNKLTTDSSSIIVLEPDYLFDATEIAESFQFNGFNPFSLLLKRLSGRTTSLNLVLGNIVNTLFDALILNPAVDFETVYYKSLKDITLPLFYLAKEDKNNKRLLKENAEAQFKNLQKIIPNLKLKKFAIEPSFISLKYGFQGRFDLLSEDSGNRKDIYELKSGRPAEIDRFFKKDGTIVKTGVYPNHFAQVTIYNMLLESCYKNRVGTSAIVYSKDNVNTLRNVPNYFKLKKEIVSARNSYIALETELLENKFSTLDKNAEFWLSYSASWTKNDYLSFQNATTKLSAIAKKFYFTHLQFVFNELRAVNFGYKTLKAANSSYWRNSLAEKVIHSNVLTGLKLIDDESDFDNMHLAFTFPERENIAAPFRKGDYCIIYPDDENSEFSPQRGRLIKCNIKDISSDKIIISLRNKMQHGIFTSNNYNWVLDFDNMDSVLKSTLASLPYFLNATDEKQKIIMGIQAPVFSDRIFNLPDNLSNEQAATIQKALNAKDYFLIQGPPGTGKTKHVLRGIVETLLNSTDEMILVLAYTNRAVDEICAAIKSIENFSTDNHELIRLGKKDSTEHKEISLDYITSTNDINTVYKNFAKTRIFAATVSSVLTYPVLLDIVNFNTLIIDEASQITEPNILGLVSKIPRFIMIGDEKQLPPIVLQENSFLADGELEKIHLNNPATSLFERLLRCSKQNNWDSYAMLTLQARMHTDVMDFPGKNFYQNKLKIFDVERQSTEENIFRPDGLFLSKQMSQHRFIFINTGIEIHSKFNSNEADAVIKIIETIKKSYGNNFNEHTIGVISPFRLQCVTINKKLSDEERNLISVDTVEKYQGSQRDIIIITMAVNNKYLLNNAQSVTEIDGQIVDRKLNVALTRARSHVIILGNEQILSNSKIYKNLINYCRSNNAFYDLGDLIKSQQAL